MTTWRATVGPATLDITLPTDPTTEQVRAALPGLPITACIVTPEVIALTIGDKHYLEFRQWPTSDPK